jgi:Amidohydrolase family
VSPYWACRSGYIEELTEPFIGPERSARMYPFGSLLRAGPRLAFGSDWTVSTANPLLQIEVAVMRIAPDTRWLEPLLPDEGLDLATALTTFTAGSAYVNFLEARPAPSSRRSRPTWSCSTATSSTQAQARSATPGSSSRCSPGRRSTPIPGSAGSSAP